MKKLLFLLLTVIMTLTVNAERVSKQEALLKAQQFMPNKQFGEAKTFARGEKADSPAEYEAFYIFNVGNKGGFVIVSGDDRTEPILGYSDRGSLNPDSVPDNVKWLLGYYERVLTAIANDKNYTRPARTRGAEERAKVETLMATEWGQDFPYNIKCPIFNGQRSVTGCVATAMAQVLNYNRWPKDYTSAVPAYTTWSNQIYMPQLEPVKFGWGTESLQFFGNLMLYCGQAVEMNYGVDLSAADVSIIPDVLKTIFGYPDGAKFVVKEEYTEEEWDNMMYAEMAGGRPVIYSGSGESMTGYMGHAFVIDGYDSGHYHVNWGWDGDSNGMFMFTGLNVTGASFNDYQSAVIGIRPPEGTSKGVKPMAQVNDIYHHNNSKYIWRQDDGKFSAINISAFVYGTTSDIVKLQLGWGLYNENGLVNVYAQEQQEISPDYSDAYYHQALITIDEDIADGDYSLLPVYRSNGSEEWIADAMNISGLGMQPGAFTEIHISNNLLKLIYADASWSKEGLEKYNSHGYLITDGDGVTFDLWQELDNYYATVIPPQIGDYSGNIVIPDMVSYQSKDYRVYDADLSAFVNCLDLISLSTSMCHGPKIENCPQLANIELREGVIAYNNWISYCPTLNNIEFPASLSDVGSTIGSLHLSYCEKLNSIKFKSTDQIIFSYFPVWSELPLLTDVYFLSKYPPTTRYRDSAFSIAENVTLHIPKGCMPLYKNSIWKDWDLSDDQDVTENHQITWEYSIDHNDAFENGFVQIGSTGGYDVDLAIHVPAEMLDKYKNQRIIGIEFICSDYIDSSFPDYVFITKPGTDYLVKQSVNVSHTMGWKRVLLSEPYTITGDELFVGIGRNYFLDFHTSVIEPNEGDGQWSRVMDDKKHWVNQYNAAIGHPLTLRFIIEGENMPKDICLCRPKLVNEDYTNKIQVSVINRCTELLTSYTVNWDFDGKVKGTKTIETRLASSLVEVINLELPSDLSGFQHTLTLDVISVNGEEDAIPANSHIVYAFTTHGTLFPRTMVLEDFVATGCGWSPRGYATAEKMYERYPNNFIAIDIHNDGGTPGYDVVGVPCNYKAYLDTYTSTPTFFINRVKTIDSTLDEAAKACEEQKDNADAIIMTNAVFASEDNTSVKVKSASTFGFTDDGNADFRIAYVVVEDNVGPYNQGNFYSDASKPDNPNDYLNEWYKKGNSVEMKFNNVARGIYPGLSGMEGSVPTSVEKGKAYEYEYTFDLPDNIQDKKNISIVTLLIDNKSGEIINADKTAVVEGELPDIFVEDAVVYEKQDEGKVAITDNGNSGDKFEIPETVTHDGVEYQVTAIAEKAFENKTNMKEVTIPQSVTVIGESAFAGCSNLAAIYCYAENPANLTGTVKARSRSGEEVSVASKVFEGVDKETCVLWVPKGCVAAYRNASGWGEFTNIKEMFKPGDANGDGELSETDRSYIVRHIMGDTPDDFDEKAANLNGDEKIDVVDLVLLNQLLGENTSSLP